MDTDDLLEVAYEAGLSSGEYGLALSSNPYDKSTNGSEFVTWRAGWFDGNFEREDAGEGK